METKGFGGKMEDFQGSGKMSDAFHTYIALKII